MPVICLGLKDFKILPIEPLAINSVKIGETQGSVSLKQEYRNVKLYGLTKGLQVYNYQYVTFKENVTFITFLACYLLLIKI